MNIPASLDPRDEGARSVVVMLAGRLLLQLAGFITVLVLPNVLVTQDYGRLAAILSLVTMANSFSDVGLGWFEMRFLGPAWRENDRVTALRLGSTTFFVKLVFDVLLTLLLLACLAVADLGVTASDLLWIGVWMFARFGITVVAVTHLPLGNRLVYVVLELFRSLGHLLAVVTGYTLNGLPGVFIALGITHVLIFLPAVLHLRCHFPVSRALVSLRALRQHRVFIGWSALSAAMASIYFWLPIFLVGAFHDVIQAALLGLALQLLGMLNGLATGMRQALLPIVATARLQGDGRLASNWMALLARLVTVLVAIALPLWVGYGDLVVAMLWPLDYAELHLELGMVLLAFAFLNIAACSDSLLNLAGFAGYAACNQLLCLLVIVGGTAVLVTTGAPHAARYVCGLYVLAMLSWTLLTQWRLRSRGEECFAVLPPLIILVSVAALGMLYVVFPAVPRFWCLVAALFFAAAMLAGGFVRHAELAGIRSALRGR